MLCIPIVQYICSCLQHPESVHCGYNILISQLHRFSQLIMCRGNFIVEVAKLVKRMHHRGYHLPILWRKLKYTLKVLPLPYGDSTFHPLFTYMHFRVLSEVGTTVWLAESIAAWDGSLCHPLGRPKACVPPAWPPPSVGHEL
jgi:hypothetical protein